MTRIILLDVDGVMVQPAGYRAGLRATLNYFIDPPLEISEEMLAELEKHEITSEWDMAPLFIASYWQELLSRQPVENLPSEPYKAAMEINRRRKVDPPRHVRIPHFPHLPGKYPSQSALEAGCFPLVPEELLKNLLAETRDVYRSHTTRIFQHFTLGSKHFEETYGLTPEFKTDSYLLLHDETPIDAEIRAKLIQPGHHLGTLTNRPSGPPREMGLSVHGYPPEAELALELAGLKDIPSISFGRIEYLAAEHNLDPAALVKPSPFHALAAVLAAWTGEEWTALQAAHHWFETGSLNGKFISLPRTFDLIVVEDTMAGIISVREAGEILNAAGFQVEVFPFGLTAGNPAKASAFESAGVPHYPDWRSLIDMITK